jgi:AAHS family 4-hydroxybenzoate transporter-like MFS transporter
MEHAALRSSERISRLQLLVAALCFLTILIDGFDTQSAAFAGPLLKQEFAGGPQALGLIFGLGMFGGLLGGVILGPLGDRFGRRPLLISALCIMSAGSIATGFAHSAHEVALLRLLTGLGLGGAVPNVIALTAEYAPLRSRSTIVSIVFNGFPLGAMLGSIVAARLLPTFGWRTLFIVGGSIPVVALILVALLLPESPAFLMRGGRTNELRHIIARLGNSSSILLTEPVSGGVARGSVLRLFADGLGASTALIWTGTLLSILCIYCTVNWLPVLIAGGGLPLQTAILAVGALNIGSVIGNIILARFGDRNTAYVPTAVFYVLGAAFLSLVGVSGSSSALMLSMTFGAGFFGFGGQLSVTTITARLYPTELRATGSGWAFGIGRVGGVIGPIFAGFLLGYGMGFATMMTILGGLMLLAGLAIFFLGRTRNARQSRAAAEAIRAL